LTGSIFNKISVVADLIKYRLSAAVTLSAVTGYYIARPETGSGVVFCATGLFCIASGAAALNQYTEKRYDAIMERTRQRPIPSKRISDTEALSVALMFFASGSILLAITGIVPVLLALLTVILYNLIYTRLKKISVLAILPGALVGALPPLIGFTAAGGILPGREILFFAGFMFLWQILHFRVIGIRYADDYRAAGFKLAFTSQRTLFYRAGNYKGIRSEFILLNTLNIAVMAAFIINSFISAN
jgi:protoheme IX farnesyltransferase